MYTSREEPYEGRANEIVPADDILTLYAQQLAGARTMTDEQISSLKSIVDRIAKNHIVTLYVRQYELLQRIIKLEQQVHKGER